MQLLSLLLFAANALSGQSAYERGEALFEKGDLQGAVRQFQEAVRERPSARNWKALGAASAAANDYPAAEPAFREACRLDPQELDACYYHGRALYALDRYQQSLEVLTPLVNTDPQSWRIHLGIAQAHEALLDAAAAEKSFETAIRLSRGVRRFPDERHPRLRYGMFLFRQGRTNDAKREYERALQDTPDSARLRYELGRVWLQLNKPNRAASQLEEAVRLAPDDPQNHLLLGKRYARLGRAADAKRHVELATQGSGTSR